jgi:hypothetical protein
MDHVLRNNFAQVLEEVEAYAFSTGHCSRGSGATDPGDPASLLCWQSQLAEAGSIGARMRLLRRLDVR